MHHGISVQIHLPCSNSARAICTFLGRSDGRNGNKPPFETLNGEASTLAGGNGAIHLPVIFGPADIYSQLASIDLKISVSGYPLAPRAARRTFARANP